ncbi:MAG: hypothetical protein IV086_10295 [Hyphomonadaceae bacterium]|nr:hypothetical protein [Hyphomonadaceae bacterium]
MAVYQASYFVGIPSLLVAQAVSIGFAKFKRRRWAFAVPAISLTLFAASSSPTHCSKPITIATH